MEEFEFIGRELFFNKKSDPHFDNRTLFSIRRQFQKSVTKEISPSAFDDRIIYTTQSL
jgi:hypothetical protein